MPESPSDKAQPITPMGSFGEAGILVSMDDVDQQRE